MIEVGAAKGGVRRTRTWFAIATGVCLGLVGCGDKYPATYPVSGRVIFPNGTPLPGGNIEFAPQEGPARTSARGMIESDGIFQLTTFRDGDGAVEGRHRVLILPARRREDRSGKPSINLDPKYQSFDTSGLEFTVSPDAEQNEFEITVTVAGRSR